MSTVDEAQEAPGVSPAAALLEQQRSEKKMMKQRQRETQLQKKQRATINSAGWHRG